MKLEMKLEPTCHFSCGAKIHETIFWGKNSLLKSQSMYQAIT